MGEGFVPTCMSAAELAAWREMARLTGVGRKPCIDCPRSFAIAAGNCCNGVPAAEGSRTAPELLAARRESARLWRDRNVERARANDRAYRRRQREATA